MTRGRPDPKGAWDCNLCGGTESDVRRITTKVATAGNVLRDQDVGPCASVSRTGVRMSGRMAAVRYNAFNVVMM
ncbi:unnamed protein product [Linum trigynum]|uniref:Uncharacterized protein n=1 Tax=Linum trigynum TaxID=586398 RepID=A0AAV2DM26_9ROSI